MNRFHPKKTQFLQIHSDSGTAQSFFSGKGTHATLFFKLLHSLLKYFKFWLSLGNNHLGLCHHLAYIPRGCKLRVGVKVFLQSPSNTLHHPYHHNLPVVILERGRGLTRMPGLNLLLGRQIFKASALWADAFYKSKCPYVCLFVCVCVHFWGAV